MSIEKKDFPFLFAQKTDEVAQGRVEGTSEAGDEEAAGTRAQKWPSFAAGWPGNEESGSSGSETTSRAW